MVIGMHGNNKEMHRKSKEKHRKSKEKDSKSKEKHRKSNIFRGGPEMARRWPGVGCFKVLIFFRGIEYMQPLVVGILLNTTDADDEC